MREPEIFNQINIDLPLADIYKRLGYREGVTAMSASRQKETQEIIDSSLQFIKLRAAASIEVIKKENETIYIDSFSIQSKLLYSLLRESDEILLCAVTAGEEIIKEIKSIGKKDLTRAVIFDAVASEMADASLDWLVSYYGRQLVRSGRRLTDKRISCGFADFSIENQKKIYDLLKLKKIGVDITKQFMLVPEKSVTAVLGVIKL